MATSGTYTFGMTIADVLDEAFERAHIDPATVEIRHIKSAVRSLNLLFIKWGNRGPQLFRIDEQTHTTSAAEQSFSLASGSVDVLDVALRRSGNDTPMFPISREDYLAIADKDNQGRPDRYWIDKSTTPPTFRYWPAGENATDQIIHHRVRRPQDVSAISDNPDAPYLWQDAVCAGLAHRIAEKYGAPALKQELSVAAEMAFRLAEAENRERAPVRLRPTFGRRVR